jgi:hypothetical protein
MYRHLRFVILSKQCWQLTLLSQHFFCSIRSALLLKNSHHHLILYQITRFFFFRTQKLKNLSCLILCFFSYTANSGPCTHGPLRGATRPSCS